MPDVARAMRGCRVHRGWQHAGYVEAGPWSHSVSLLLESELFSVFDVATPLSWLGVVTGAAGTAIFNDLGSGDAVWKPVCFQRR